MSGQKKTYRGAQAEAAMDQIGEKEKLVHRRPDPGGGQTAEEEGGKGPRRGRTNTLVQKVPQFLVFG